MAGQNVIIEGLTGAQLGRSLEEWVVASTIDVAERELKAAVDGGFDAEPEVITDGVLRRDYLEVKPFGKVEFVSRLQIAEAVMWAYAELKRRSPLGPAEGGHYINDHVIMINETQVRGNVNVELRKVKAGDRVQIVNTRIYARKLEGATANKKTGRGKRKPISRQAPDGIYRPVLAALLQRWSKTVFVDYKLVTLNLGVKVWGDQGGRYRKDGTKTYTKRVLRDQVYPALQFFVRPSQVN